MVTRVSAVLRWALISQLPVLVQPAVGSAQGPVLHEYLEAVDPNEASVRLGELRGEAPPVRYDGELIPAPDPEDDRPVPVMSGRPGNGQGAQPAGQRAPSFRPDRQTQLEGQLSYFSAFNPVVAPFKRVTSLDAVVLARDGVTPVLTVAASERVTVPVESGAAVDVSGPAEGEGGPRDRFWGEVELDFSGGRVVPLPSVAPRARLLSVVTRPAVDVEVVRDGADNFFAVLRAGSPAGRVRMVFLTDARQAYFGTEIPAVPVGTLASRVPPMPPAVSAQARRFAAELGLSRDSDLRTAIHVLTGHFRAFEESAEPPADSGQIYLDLARGKRGICRHRTYGFVVTAQALGIPARFVQNEAHSFVELALPRAGFMRIDLGGAAQGVTAHGAQDRPRYRPAQADRLPRPEAYVRSYSQAAQGVAGLRPPLREPPSGAWLRPAQPLSARGPGAAPASTSSPPPPASESGAALLDSRQPLTLRLERTRSVAQRGGVMRVAGQLRDGRGLGRPGMRIEVSLASDDDADASRLLLGVTVTDADGAFRAELGLPPDLALGDYRLQVVAPGNADYLPATAE